MVKLEQTDKTPNRGYAYYRAFGNWVLSDILSRTQGLIIKYGNDLEQLILDRVDTIDDLDKHLQEREKKGIFVVPKKIIKKSSVVNFGGIEPDFMIFIQCQNKSECHMVELKDGCEFDTKSSEAEKSHLNEFIKANASKLEYTFHGHICCFNETSRTDIVKGFKNKITDKDALTGSEFCKLLEIDYEEILKIRKVDRADNLEYFLKYLLTDPDITNILKKNIDQ